MRFDFSITVSLFLSNHQRFFFIWIFSFRFPCRASGSVQEHTASKLVEVNFTMIFGANVEGDAILGLLYEEIKKNGFGNIEKLPVAQLPVFIRQNDPNLINAPYYRFRNKNDVLQLGPSMLSFASLDDGYDGWSSFSEKILHWAEILKTQSIVLDTKTISLKYINLLTSDDVLKETNLRVSLKGKKLNINKVILNTEYFDDKVKLTEALIVTNNAQVNTPGIQAANAVETKSIVDLTVVADSRNSQCASFVSSPKSLLDIMHCHAKGLYESVLLKESKK